MTPTGFLERFRIPGRVAVVTGGAGLLGTSHALALGQAGGRVVIADVDGAGAERVAAEVTENSGAEALALPTDVTDADSVRAMVDRTLQAFGRLDILVNNAALDPKFDAGSAGRHSSTLRGLPAGRLAQGAGSQRHRDVPVRPGGRPADAGGRSRGDRQHRFHLWPGGPRPADLRAGGPTALPTSRSPTRSPRPAALGLTRYLATYFAREEYPRQRADAGRGLHTSTTTSSS